MRLGGSFAVFESYSHVKLSYLAVHERFVLLVDAICLLDGIGRHGDGTINEVGEQREDLRPADVHPLLGGSDRFALGSDERVGQVVLRHACLVVIDIVIELLEFAGEQSANAYAKRSQNRDDF